MSVLSEEYALETPTLQTQKIEGALRWFDQIRGYGFIMPKDGTDDILLHNDVLREFGQTRLKPGTQISCEIMRSPKGLMATRILKILDDVTSVAKNLVNDRNCAESPERPICETDLKVAIVKWYDERKGYGFAVTHDDNGDVMLSRHILRKYGIRTIYPGDKLRIAFDMTERGLLANYIEYN